MLHLAKSSEELWQWKNC